MAGVDAAAAAEAAGVTLLVAFVAGAELAGCDAALDGVDE